MKKIKICAAALVILTILTVSLIGCAGKKEQEKVYLSMDDLQGSDKTFSLWLSCGYESYLKAAFPEAKMVFGEFVPDLALKVKQGKADAMLIPEPCFNFFSEELAGMEMLPGDLGTIEGALIFSSAPTGDALRLEFNTWLASALADGTIDEIEEKWFGTDKSARTLDYSGLDPNAEHIRVGLAADEPPFAYRKGNDIIGHDAELIVRFCKDCGYYPDITVESYDAMIISVQMDKYDVIGAGYELTKEREDSVSFSDPVSHNRIIVAVNGSKEKAGFFESVAKSFRRTFMEDNRAMQFLRGIGVTAIITVCSVVFGTLLGFCLYFLDRDGGKRTKKVLAVLSMLLNRVPSIVLLMVFYYIIFGSVNINATLVAILLFTIIFSFSTFEALALAVNSVGKGQSEAAFTLGFTRNECFFRVLLPQGRTIFLSKFKDNIVSVLLDSAVVGYVSVNDLTRVGDIIRNNTYESFFPLIAVAVFYLIISTIIIGLIERVEKRIDPVNRSRKQVLKSVLGKE